MKPCYSFEQKNFNNVQELKKKISEFESNLYSQYEIDSIQFKAHLDNFTEILKTYTSLHSSYPDSNFDEMSFQYLEKMKNQKLIYHFLNSATSKSIIEKRKGVLSENYYLLQKYEKELQFIDSDNATKLKILQHKIETFQDSIRINEPNLNLFISLQKPVELLYIQTHCLNDQEALLDFWFNDTVMNVFIVTIDSLHLMQQKVPASLKKQLFQLTSPLFNKKNLLHLEYDYRLSNLIYKNIFLPIEDHLAFINTLLIVPDDFLIGFPFELLVTDTTLHKKQHKNILYDEYSMFKYLINKYAISYNFSATTFFSSSYLKPLPKKFGRKLLTMSESVISDSMLSSLKVQNFSFTSSEFAVNEIKRISRLMWHHTNIKKERAVKEYLLNNANKYRWIHLAVPATLNNLNPSNSGIIFSQNKTGSSAGSFRYSGAESMENTIHADMVTLSSSELFPFKLEDNSGMISLPYSFLFSGAKSVLFSLWRINNIPNSRYMSKFYWELKYKRQANVQALREAKLASMKETFQYLNKNISSAHPYFWAAFVLIGNQKIRPPSNTIIPLWGIVLIIYLIVILTSLIITRKTLPERK